MSLTSTAPLSLPPHAAIDRPHQQSMPYSPAADDRNYQGYYSRPAPGSAHGAPPLEPSSPHIASANASFPKGTLPPPSPVNVYPSPHDVGPAPGSSHGYPAQQQTPLTPMSGSAYPPQSPVPPYFGMASQNPDPAALPTAPAPAGAAANARPTSSYTPDGAPIVPVGISGGKMFRCRGFGDCDKVFTRSEHLARHVRKHTGERPFPCHCGKAFSRLDNLRQHAATVHADAAQLNEAMLTQLASVHAALSQRANREQRRRGEVVEVPKNAVERPRGERGGKGAAPGGGVPPPGAVYPPAPGYHPQQWGAPPDHGRPRTAGSWVEYPYPGAVTPVGEHAPPGTAGSITYSDDAGPSRRPPSAGYPAGYYEQGPPTSSHGRPGTGNPPPPTASSDDSAAVPYGYRPMSSNGPGAPHYAESEPPSSAHGPPPHSPMYPHPTPTVAAAAWASPGTPHAGYAADPSLYAAGVPPAEGQYPPGQGPEGHYGPPPPGSSGGYYPYPPQGHGYYGQQSPAQPHQATFAPAPGVPPTGTTPTPTSAYPPAQYGGPPESPFQYNASGSYPYPGYDGRKRRAEDEAGGDRKHPRSSAEAAQASAEPRVPGAAGDPLWLPPASERRSSLAISALLGSPQQDTHGRPRPGTGDPTNPAAAAAAAAAYPYPGAPFDDRTGAPRERPAGAPEEKPKALVAE